MTKLCWLCLTIPIAWLLQNIIHEFSHLAIGKIVEGRPMKKLIFWPHKYSNRFYWARYECGSPTKNGSPIYRFIAPLFAAFIYFLIIQVLLLYGNINTKIILSPFILAPIIDMLTWIFGYIKNTPYSDGWFYRKQLENENSSNSNY